VLYVVKTRPVADLVKLIEGGKRISRESVINESESNKPQLKIVLIIIREKW
jgi:hypothetical protein